MEEVSTSDFGLIAWATYNHFQIIRGKKVDDKRVELTFKVPDENAMTSSFFLDSGDNCNAKRMFQAIREAKELVKRFVA